MVNLIFFGIPLKSKAVSDNWELVCELFNKTLWSVYNQTFPDFKIIVACHEIPSLKHEYDNRVEFIQINTSVPKDSCEMMADKGYKVHTIAMRIRELGAGYAMIVDADDLISNKIVEYVSCQPVDSFGWIINKGYVYYYGNTFVTYTSKNPSGTSIIINYCRDDLPRCYDEVMEDNNNNNCYLIRKRHGDISKFCKLMGRPLKKLPFPGTIYVRYGENHSPFNSIFRKVHTMFGRKYGLEQLKEEFSLDWDTYPLP